MRTIINKAGPGVRVLALLLAVVLGASVAPAAAHAEEADRRLLYRTHVDAAHIAHEDGGLVIRVIDGQKPIDADSVHVRLGPDADSNGNEVSRIEVPADPAFAFLGEPGEVLWNAPSQLHDGWAPVWAGFGVGKFPADFLRTIYPESVRLEMVAVEGPGDLEVWAGDLNYVARQFSSRYETLRVQHMIPGAHGHFNWSFTAPGRYQVSWRAHADLRDGGTISSPVQAVSWLVGTDEQVGLTPGTTRGAAILNPVDSGDFAPVPAPVEPTPTRPAEPEQDNFTEGVECVRVSDGVVEIRAAWDGSYLDDGYPSEPTLTASGPTGELTSRRTLIELGGSTSVEVPSNPALNAALPAGSTAWQMSAGGSPSHAFDTTGVDHTSLFESDLAWMVVTVPDGGRVVLTSGTGDALKVELDSANYSMGRIRFQGGGTLDDRSLWFSKEGLYAVDWSYMIHARDLLPSGETAQNYDNFTTWYAVGDTAIERACANGPSVPEAPAPTEPAPTAEPTPTATAPAAPPVATDRIELSKGHVDAFAVSMDGDELRLQLQEDVTGSHVPRRPEDVTLRVLPEALSPLPEGFPGAPEAYVLPLVQDHAILWPGWDTQPLAAAGIGEVKLRTTDVEGPGEVHVFGSGVFGGLSPLLESGGTRLPDTIVVPFPAHVHANWVFTEPGTYTFDVTATAERDGVALTSNTATYTWVVGDLPEPEPTPDPTPDPTPTPTPEPTPTAEPTPEPTPTAEPTPEPTPTAEPTPEPTRTPEPTVQPTSEPTPTREPSPAPTTAPGTPGTTAPVPTTGPAPSPRTTEEACFPVPADDKAAKPADKAKPTRSVINDGHLDLGAKLEGGKLVAALKDDRTQPARWVDPSSVVLHLGDKSRAEAPAGMEFIAAAGSDIWLSASTQVPGVPWLGQNTMHESIVAGTTGPVEWVLKGVKGPGEFAAFNSGMFGGGVGERVFDTVGGPKKFTVRANTHAHPNWVFSNPGTYEVTITQTATTKAGSRVSDTATLHFAVGVAPEGAAAAAGVTSPTAADAGAQPRQGRTTSGEPCTLRPGMPGAGGYGLTQPAAGQIAGTVGGGAAALALVALAAVVTAGIASRRRVA